MTPYYQSGGITIYHGKAEDVLPSLGPASIDLVLTDPPYQSLNYEVSIGTTTRLVGRNERVGTRLASTDAPVWFETLSDPELLAIFAACRSVIAPTGALYVFADVKSGLHLFPALQPANVLVWDKGKLGMGFNWRRMHEWIAYCPQPKHQLRSAALGDILRFSGVQDKVHPTEKPVALLRTIIQNSTDEGQTVLDLFCGSGSGLRAAKDTGRRAIGVDSDERWCEIAALRLQQSVLNLSGITAAD